ncbi:MAG: hypothetical protein WC799_22305 [Desulfobacteraceae bacterium]|jgi:hypothetical protein
MYFLLSGEGQTDMGRCPDNINVCEGSRHLSGPMAIIVSQIVEQRLGFSFMDTQRYGFVSEKELVNKASVLKSIKKPLMLTGQKKKQETGYFYRNARALALCAKEKEAELGDQVIAVFFRDSDGTASADRGLWKDKWDSMIRGFNDEGFDRGVPMMPKPKSEAWIICAIKKNPYQGCNALEERSGNDKSPKALKKELAEILGALPTREMLCGMVNDGTIDINRIDMPSFQAFRSVLLDKLS